MSGALVIGVGPGIGTSVARAFAREGLPVGLLARSETSVETTRQALADLGVPVHPAVGGPVAPGSPWDPDEVAKPHVRLHAQARPSWEREVLLSGPEDAVA